MLILTRNPGERIIIGDGLITITVLEKNGSQVRLGICAPTELPVHREEIYERIQRKKDKNNKTKNPKKDID